MSKNIYIFANRQKDGSFTGTEIVDDLDRTYSRLEYGDVAEHEYQLWEYPSGKIFRVDVDRQVAEKDYCASTHSTKGIVWLPKLVEIGVDEGKVTEAYKKLQRA